MSVMTLIEQQSRLKAEALRVLSARALVRKVASLGDVNRETFKSQR